MNHFEFCQWLSAHADAFPNIRFWMNESRTKSPDAHERTLKAWEEILVRVPLDVATSATRRMLADEEHHPRRVEQHPGRVLRYFQEHVVPRRDWKAQGLAATYRCPWCLDSGRVLVPIFGEAKNRAIAVYGENRAERMEVMAGCWCDAGHDSGLTIAPPESKTDDLLRGESVGSAKVRETMQFIGDYLAGRVTREEYGKRFPLPETKPEPRPVESAPASVPF